MTVGRELDVLIAEHILGHGIVRQKKGTIKERVSPQIFRPLRAYSKDIGAAWEVVERLKITLIPIEGDRWFSFVGKRAGWESPADLFKYLQEANFVESGAAIADTAPLAICLAAIKTIEKGLVAEMPVQSTATH
jgi:hypothetical protein